MGSARSTTSLMLVLGFLSTVHVWTQIVKTEGPTTEFIFRGFRGNQSEILTAGDATITPDGLLRLTDQKLDITGTSFYRKPVRLLATDRSSTNSMVRSFSTCFVFVIIPTSPSNGGYGLTLTISPTPNRTGADSGQYLGLLNNDTNGNPRNHVFALEFDTAQGFKDGDDRAGNHIGINYNSLTSDIQEAVVYHDNDDPGRKEDFTLQSGDPIRALLNKKASAHYVMGWSFSSGGEHPVAAMLNLSDLPRRPLNTEKKRGYDSKDIAMIVALSVVTLILLVSLIFFVMYKKRLQQGEILEDWEINHPHRLRYKDLYSATDGFNEDRIIGAGGFGTVFRGSLSSSSSDQIAVKKIVPNSMQGIREFIAEIESLGRLSHKNLVKLRGWCKHKGELLLTYDYIPKGSLYSLLYTIPRQTGAVLSWDVRFQIAKGIASGLLYLHEEWEQIVVHRDVKTSNVLIDEDMNPRLGDFGLARLCERGSQSHTTVIVGSQGYMAPEITRNGVSSPASDVFAFGVLLLEIVSGRKPTDSESFFLPDWVMELHASGEKFRAVDPKLKSGGYDVGEAKLALAVGLLCCRQRPVSRPSMRMVMRYLNGDEEVPELDN
ncbi:Lectin-domain containing receptor kinase VI.3 [Cardamine amara subsp. amara]|uniref:non-specific serine/threonine protein kinase n=1 Tax=Cardamine amara subsp. amara TaxID=228776 RepID=A0ABD1BUM2_CARAN